MLYPYFILKAEMSQNGQNDPIRSFPVISG
jgi:hypothetical protein